jgi:ATP-binding cassette subfamily B protein
MPNDIGVIRFIVRVAYPFRWLIVSHLFISALWAAIMSIRPYTVKLILDAIPEITITKELGLLVIPVLAYLSVELLTGLSLRWYDFIFIRLVPRLKKNIGILLMDKMMLHSYSFFQHYFAGNLANKVNDVINGVPDILRVLIDTFFSYTIAISIAIYTVWFVDSKFAIGLFIWILFFVIVSVLLSKKINILSNRAAEARARVSGEMVDIFINMASVRFFNGRKKEHDHITHALQKFVVAAQKRDWLFFCIKSLQEFSFIIFQAICLYWLVSGLKDNHVTVGDFALVIGVNISIVECLWELSRDFNQIAEYFGNVSQGLHLITMPPDVHDKLDAHALTVTKGRIVFDHVYFGYKNAPLLFEDTSIVIEPGQKVGLVGHSGSGKTTFVNILLRLFDLNSGSITIDGQNIADATHASLHNAISIIPQDVPLFNRTIIENIRYARTDATNEQVYEAAHKALVDSFMTQTIDDTQMLVGERGTKLSGGQRQRIAIARAILKNAPILILDEATSQLDSVTEIAIQNQLWDLMHDKTTLVIAHRLSTLLHMDRILVFDHGRIVEDGSHTELLAHNGLYKRFWDSQTGGLLSNVSENK